MKRLIIELPALVVAAALVFLAVTMLRQHAAATPRPSVAGAGGVPRVVALAPAPAQMLREAGAGELLVGRHAFDVWSDPALPICGDQAGIDYEALINARPTHVLIQWGARELPSRLTELAAVHSWRVINLPLLKLDEVPAATSTLAPIVEAWRDALAMRGIDGAKAQAALGVLRSWPAAFKESTALDASLARVGRVLLLHTTSPPQALGPGSYHHDILLALGASSATPTGAAYIALDAEDVLRLKPDAIILVQPAPVGAGIEGTVPAGTPIGDRLGTLASLNVPAIVNGRVAVISEADALVPGMNLKRFAERLRATLAAWAK